MSDEEETKVNETNPYIDQSLMQDLSDFNSKGNEHFLTNHGVSHNVDDKEHEFKTELQDNGSKSPKAVGKVKVGVYGSSIAFKTYRRERWFDTKQRMQFIDITSEIEGMLEESNITDGVVLVSPMHITASVVVQDNDKALHSDFKAYLEGLVPNDESMELDLYHHNSWGDANGDSHIKRQLFKREVFISVTNGKLDFAENERIIYSEFDGRRRKRVLIKIIGY